MAYGLRCLLLVLLASPAQGAGDSITIPVEIVEGNNVAIVEAGGATLRAHIDTGGFKAIGVFTDALSRMSVQFLPGMIERTDGSGTTFAGRTFVIRELKLGAALTS